MSALLYRLGALCARRKYLVIAIWLLAVVAIVAGVRIVGARTNNDVRLPGTGSQRASNLLSHMFAPQQNGENPVVFHVTRGKLTDAANRRAIEAALRNLTKTAHVYSVISPFSRAGETFLSSDGKTAVAQVLLDVNGGQLTQKIAGRVFAAADPARKAGIQVAVGGSVGTLLSETQTRSSEIIGISVAIVILAFTFGALVAAGLPIVTALVGLLTGLSLIGLLGHFVATPDQAPTVATMIGLGVGIDYALFIVFRHRDHLHAGFDVRESIARTMATSGNAVVFAGGTVIIALLALLVANVPILGAMGYAAGIAVLVAILTAVTLLPAILALLGRRLEAVRIPGRRRLHDDSPGENVWGRWAGLVTRHPWIGLGAALLVMVPLMVPTVKLTLGQEDDGVMPASSTLRQAYDLISASFGPGTNGPLVVAAELRPAATPSTTYTTKVDAAQRLARSLKTGQQNLSREAAALKERQAALTAASGKLHAQAASLAAQQGSLQTSAASLAAQQQSLQGQAATLREQQSRLLSEKASLAASETKLTASLQALAAKGQALAAQSAAVQQQIAATQDPVQIAALETELADLAKQAQAVQAKVAALQKDGAALAQQASRLAVQEQTLQSVAAELSARGTALQNQATALRAQGATLQAEASRLTTQGDSLKSQGQALARQGDRLKQQERSLAQQAKQARTLKTELTRLLTKAGGQARATDPRIVRLQDALAQTSGVASVAPPLVNTSGSAVVLAVTATTRPADPRTTNLVSRLRSTVIPAATAGTGVTAYVGGATAAWDDLATLISRRLPLVIATVLGFSFLILLVAFRSLLVPLKAIICNLLAVGASFGVLTAFFQWGWGLHLVGLANPYGTVPIASYVPLLMFAGLFGVSTDYEVFLVSRIFEAHTSGKAPHEAVRIGVGATARVITAAALIMVSVFASFILNGDPVIKQFGVGLSVAILLDATVVRMVIVPATMVLLGKWNWYLPKWLAWLPRMDMPDEVTSRPTAETAAAVVSVSASVSATEKTITAGD
jgi:uncharacterized membrane protein YdfJ with MMPL/SSD domain